MTERRFKPADAAHGRARRDCVAQDPAGSLALFHHISTDLFWEAFYELKKDAALGVDRRAGVVDRPS
jgi:hypothetical protein